ncbi:hypothetical protein HMPREF9129_2001, partial [Peptoniphilus indolicus ATCC 29427]
YTTVIFQCQYFLKFFQSFFPFISCPTDLNNITIFILSCQQLFNLFFIFC